MEKTLTDIEFLHKQILISIKKKDYGHAIRNSKALIELLTRK